MPTGLGPAQQEVFRLAHRENSGNSPGQSGAGGYTVSYFYFSSVTLEQCRSEGAMILFTVMDHDVLTSNDFAGEAFLSLNTIPGVADNSASIDNFHGLKTQDLNLMHQKNRSRWF